MTRDTSLTSFRADTRAVAPLIGIILIFGTLVVVYAGYQAEIVPNQNNEIEFQHFEDVQNEMVDVRRAVLTAGQVDISQISTVTLGTNYPARLISINPPTPVGTLKTSDTYNITIRNESGSKINVSTRFLEYQNRYNEMEAGSIWYENSVLYIDTQGGSGNPVILEDQNLLTSGQTLQITALQNEFRESGTERVTLELYPTQKPAKEIPTGNLTITLPTQLTAGEYWEDAFNDSSNIYQNITPNAYEQGVHRLNLNITSERLEINTVGIQEEPEANDSVKQGSSNDRDGNGDGGGGDFSGGGDDTQATCAEDIQANGGNAEGYELKFEVTNNASCDPVTITSFKIIDLKGNDLAKISRDSGDPTSEPRNEREYELEIINFDGTTEGYAVNDPNNAGQSEYDIGDIYQLTQDATIPTGESVEISIGYFFEPGDDDPSEFQYTINPGGNSATHRIRLGFEDSSPLEINIRINS